ncbi:hypothetical protein [Nibricoccus sp. IMCC34717]|uniref:hypothetical protein n=1 Tax=Nibricoccus sp. IMCC34717 TaxID=3034021 RepID=UPI00384CF1B8
MRMLRTMILLPTLVACVTAQEKISTDSPFALPGGQTTAPTVSGPAPGPVEFCGMLRSGGKILYGLYDTAAQKGRWLQLDQESEGWRVVAFDESRRQLTVVIQGNSQVLALREPKFEGGSGGAVAMAPQGAPPPPAAVSPADEAARLKAVAEEIKRRRQLRQKQAQQQQPPVPGQGPAQP